MRYLCLDVGDKRTGAAVGDDETGIVSPVGMVESALDGPLIDRLILVVDEHGPDELVIGLPLNMDARTGRRPGASPLSRSSWPSASCCRFTSRTSG